MTSPLFAPFTLNKLALANRWVMPAMQRGMCVNGAPEPELAAYYARRAEGGVPLVIGARADGRRRSVSWRRSATGSCARR